MPSDDKTLNDLAGPIDEMIQIFGADPTKWLVGAPQGLELQQTPGTYLAVITISHGSPILNAKGQSEGEMNITPLARAMHNPAAMTKGQAQAVCSILNYSMFRMSQVPGVTDE